MNRHDLSKTRDIGLKFENETAEVGNPEAIMSEVERQERDFLLNFEAGVQVSLSSGPGVNLDDESKNVVSEEKSLKKTRGPRVRRV